ARSLDGNDGVYMVPAFVGLGAPHWQPEARGTLTGLTRGTTRAHLARAALEAMAYGTRDVLGAMELDAGLKAPSLRVDGGATRNEWLLEFMAGVLGIPVHRPDMVETTALGAAGLAGLASGVWDSAEGFMEAFGAGRSVSPTMEPEERRELVSGWERAVAATLAAVPASQSPTA
ncbi:MAG: glycerol kinase, partial [Gemmatimonadetes bacterium]|nr:glycerol kinase [Gemmatimonadota bacterium]